MDLPHSAFYNYAKMNAFFVIDNKIYPIKSRHVKNENHIIDVQSMPIGMEILETVYLSDLERLGQFKKHIQEKKNESEHTRLARFMLEDVLGGKSGIKKRNKECIIGKVIPKNGILIKYGLCYEIYSDAKGSVIVNGTRYSSSKKPYTIEEIETRYLRKISETIFSPCLESITADSYYDNGKEMGFLIDGDDFYAYTEVGPYALYERDDMKYYWFSKARVGSRLILKGDKMEWNRLVVIDSYTHPSLPEQDKPFQVICVGSFNYDSIEAKYPDNQALQVMDLMRKGKKVLTAEYTSQGRPWHRLTENMFSERIMEERTNIAALNY